MSWETAMRWAQIRARDTGERQRVYGYRLLDYGWAYSAGPAKGGDES